MALQGPPAIGTYVMDQWMGAVEDVLFNNNNTFDFPYTVPMQKLSCGWDVQFVLMFDFMPFKNAIGLGNPLKLDFKYWNVSLTGLYIFNMEFAEDTVFIYKWNTKVNRSGVIDKRRPPET